jgi:uncharacterized membrane protein YkoI
MKIRTKAVAAGAAVLVIGGLGTGAVVASASGADLNPLDGRDLGKAEQAALEHVGAGEVTGAEAEDDADGVAYEVEVTRPDGTTVDVDLDGDYAVLTSTEDDSDSDSDSDGDSDTDGADADDRALAADEQKQAEQAALAEVGRGTVTDSGAESDIVDGKKVAYEVEVTRADGTEVDVYLGSNFAVVTTVEDGTDSDDEGADGTDD